jgi:hypothetical protein
MEICLQTWLCHVSTVGSRRVYPRSIGVVADERLALAPRRGGPYRELALHALRHNADQQATEGHQLSWCRFEKSHANRKVGQVARRTIYARLRCHAHFPLGVDDLI